MWVAHGAKEDANNALYSKTDPNQYNLGGNVPKSKNKVQKNYFYQKEKFLK